ncbi:MAG: hypothetical protein DMF69_19710 [Acidobacteria bacterium]|nr:MAG: hypothetical protein DMF69_19710 [Acidobacteriota bacterium]
MRLGSLQGGKVHQSSTKGLFMQNESGLGNPGVLLPNSEALTNRDRLHPAWSAFITYCSELEHGEIEILRIQNGLPVLAEITRKKIKFTL